MATDTDLPTLTLTFSLSNEPAGATIDPSTGLFTWLAGSLGVYTPPIAVADGVVTTSQTISITVMEPSHTLTLQVVGQGNVSPHLSGGHGRNPDRHRRPRLGLRRLERRRNGHHQPADPDHGCQPSPQRHLSPGRVHNLSTPGHPGGAVVMVQAMGHT